MLLDLVFCQADGLVLCDDERMEPDAARGHGEVLPLRVLLGQGEVLARMRPVAGHDHRHRRLMGAHERSGDLTGRLEQVVDAGVEFVVRVCLRCGVHPFAVSW
jgi:hypothetical protein